MKLRSVAGIALAAFAFAVNPAASRELVYATMLSPKHPTNRLGVEAFFERVTKATNGSLTVKLFSGGSLASGKTTLNAVRSGTADMGLIIDVYTPSNLSVSALLSDMAVWGEDPRVMAAAVNETMLVDCEECKEDLLEEKVLPLAYYSTSPYYLLCRDAEIVSADDWNGKKVRGTGAMGVLAANMGATPVNITSAEAYEAMQRGQIDCAMLPTPHLESYSLWDVVTGVSDSPLGTFHGNNFLNINTKVWKKLSKEEKKAIGDNIARAVTDMSRAYMEDEANVRATAEAKGVRWIEVDDSFSAAVQKQRENDVARVIALAKDRGVENPEPIAEMFQENIAKWKKHVDDIGTGEWTDAEWAKYQEALQAEIFDKISYE